MKESYLVSDKVIREFLEFRNGVRGFVFFRTECPSQKHTAFLCIHGNKEGLMTLGPVTHTPHEVLETLSRKIDFKSKGITEIKTISCYGGYQESSKLNGVSISSTHSIKDTIYFSTHDRLLDLRNINTIKVYSTSRTKEYENSTLT